jgi:hypothetical protein
LFPFGVYGTIRPPDPGRVRQRGAAGELVRHDVAEGAGARGGGGQRVQVGTGGDMSYTGGQEWGRGG